MKRKLLVLMLVIGMLFVGCSQEEDPEVTESTGTGSIEETDEDQSSEDKTEEKQVIKVGTTSNYLDVVEFAKKDFDESDYEMKIVVFDDFIQPNTALAEGSIDANLYQHKPFLDNYNEDHDTDLVMNNDRGIFAPTKGLYSSKINNLDELEVGNTVGIPNDPSNISIGLLVMEENNLIRVDKDVTNPTLLDIVENPKELEFIEIGDGRSVIASIDDVDMIFASGDGIVKAGIDPTSALAYGSNDLLVSSAIGIVTREEDKDAKWIIELHESLSNDNMMKFFEDEFKGVLTKIH